MQAGSLPALALWITSETRERETIVTAVQAFWHVLYTLIHTPGAFQAWAVVGGQPHIVYGGSAIQAFLVALHGHGSIFWGPLHH